MTQKKVVNGVRDDPEGQREDARIHIEGCRITLLVLNRQVFGCEQSGKGAFDGMEGHLSLSRLPT